MFTIPYRAMLILVVISSCLEQRTWQMQAFRLTCIIGKVLHTSQSGP